MMDLVEFVEIDSLEREMEFEEMEITKLILARQGLAHLVSYRTLDDATQDFLSKFEKDESLANSAKWSKKYGQRLIGYLGYLGMTWHDFLGSLGIETARDSWKKTDIEVNSLDEAAIVFQKYLRRTGQNIIQEYFWQKPKLKQVYQFVVEQMEWIDFVHQFGGIPPVRLRRWIRDSWTEDDMIDKATEIIKKNGRIPSAAGVGGLKTIDYQLFLAINERYSSWKKFVENVLHMEYS